MFNGNVYSSDVHCMKYKKNVDFCSLFSKRGGLRSLPLISCDILSVVKNTVYMKPIEWGGGNVSKPSL